MPHGGNAGVETTGSINLILWAETAGAGADVGRQQKRAERPEKLCGWCAAPLLLPYQPRWCNERSPGGGSDAVLMTAAGRLVSIHHPQVRGPAE